MKSIEDLIISSARKRREVAAHAGPSGDMEIDIELDRITRDEVSQGWLTGPFTSAELDEKLGDWLPSRRFGVKQGGRVRPIDD